MTWIKLSDADEAVIAEIESERDRGAALIASAFLEARLEEAIKSRLRKDKAIEDGLFRGMGGLSTFSAKINLGYLLQIYPEGVRKLLSQIKDIRNDFAHLTEPISFKTMSVAARCENIRTQLPTAAGSGMQLYFNLTFLTGHDGPALDLPEGKWSLDYPSTGDARGAFMAAVKFSVFLLAVVGNVYKADFKELPLP